MLPSIFCSYFINSIAVLILINYSTWTFADLCVIFHSWAGWHKVTWHTCGPVNSSLWSEKEGQLNTYVVYHTRAVALSLLRPQIYSSWENLMGAPRAMPVSSQGYIEITAIGKSGVWCSHFKHYCTSSKIHSYMESLWSSILQRAFVKYYCVCLVSSKLHLFVVRLILCEYLRYFWCTLLVLLSCLQGFVLMHLRLWN